MSCSASSVRSIRLLNYVPNSISYMSRYRPLNRNIITSSKNFSCLGKNNFSMVAVKRSDIKCSSVTLQTLRCFRFVKNILENNRNQIVDSQALFIVFLVIKSCHNTIIFKILQNVNSTPQWERLL